MQLCVSQAVAGENKEGNFIHGIREVWRVQPMAPEGQGQMEDIRGAASAEFIFQSHG